MEILRQKNGSFLVSEIEPAIRDFLMAIPASADPEGSNEANERLFPEPCADPSAAILCEEWKEYVQPAIHDWFENAATTVEADLESLANADNFVIPLEHVDAWLNTLNQARLVLAARYDVTEEDMDRPVSRMMEDERDYALFQIHLYGFIQECLIRGME